MEYFIQRGEQQFGPYSLADLQRYLHDGNITPDDLARSEAMEEWLPVSQVVGNISATQSGAQSAFAGSTFGDMNRPVGLAPTDANKPPGIHWSLVLLLTVVTCSLFGAFWGMIQCLFARRLRSDCRAWMYFAGYIVTAFLWIMLTSRPNEVQQTAGVLCWLASIVFYWAAAYSIRNAMLDYYNSDENIGLRMSGVSTFFFTIFYIQYHLSRIAEWKKTGYLPQD